MRFRDHRVVGEIEELAARYRDAGADELVFYDITASPHGRTVDRSWVSRVARLLDIPFCVAGGIRSVADAEAVLGAGAEKISVNSPALSDPALITALAERFGSQCVVVGIDSQTVAGNGGTRWEVHQFTGDPARSRATPRDTLAWVRLDGDGRIARAHLRDASWFQWPLLEAAIEGNIVADFPLCNKSFNCSYSGHDL